MIKKLIVLGLFLSCAGYLVARDNDYDCCCECNNDPCRNWQLVFKQGYFVPHDKTLRCMLEAGGKHSGGYFLELAGRYRLVRGLFLDINGSWFKHDGCSLVCTVNKTEDGVTTQTAATETTYGEKFTYKLPTFGAGLKYFHEMCNDCFNIFAGAGFKAFFMRTNVACEYPGCCNCDANNSVGGFVGAGIQYKPFCHFIIEGFVDYLTKTVSTKKDPLCCSYTYCLDVSGVVAGIGLGWQF